MYHTEETHHAFLAPYSPPQPQQAIFDALPGEPNVNSHYYLCRGIQDILDIHGEMFALHIQAELTGPKELPPGLTPGYLEFIRDTVRDRITYAFGQDQANITDLQCLCAETIYTRGESQLHPLLLVKQNAFDWLGLSEGGSRGVLEEFIADAWRDLQALEYYHPRWINSSHKVIGNHHLLGSRHMDT